MLLTVPGGGIQPSLPWLVVNPFKSEVNSLFIRFANHGLPILSHSSGGKPRCLYSPCESSYCLRLINQERFPFARLIIKRLIDYLFDQLNLKSVQKRKNPDLQSRSGCFVFGAWQWPTLTWGNPTLPSAIRRFTSEFGMGSGGTNVLWSSSNSFWSLRVL